jgi:hypothetical protein
VDVNMDVDAGRRVSAPADAESGYFQHDVPLLAVAAHMLRACGEMSDPSDACSAVPMMGCFWRPPCRVVRNTWKAKIPFPR